MTKQVQQRFPIKLLDSINTYASHLGLTRTSLINIMCQHYLDHIEVEKLKFENSQLREKIIKVVLAKEGG